jgi:hypothetical protein
LLDKQDNDTPERRGGQLLLTEKDIIVDIGLIETISKKVYIMLGFE